MVTVVGVTLIFLALMIEKLGNLQPAILSIFGVIFLWGGSFYRKKLRKLDAQLSQAASYLEINLEKGREYINE